MARQLRRLGYPGRWPAARCDGPWQRGGRAGPWHTPQAVCGRAPIAARNGSALVHTGVMEIGTARVGYSQCAYESLTIPSGRLQIQQSLPVRAGSRRSSSYCDGRYHAGRRMVKCLGFDHAATNHRRGFGCALFASRMAIAASLNTRRPTAGRCEKHARRRGLCLLRGRLTADIAEPWLVRPWRHSICRRGPAWSAKGVLAAQYSRYAFSAPVVEPTISRLSGVIESRPPCATDQTIGYVDCCRSIA
jgi:hypothetical protein